MCAMEMDHLKILLLQKHKVNLILNILQSNERHLQDELGRSQGSTTKIQTQNQRALTLTLGLGLEVLHLLSSGASERPLAAHLPSLGFRRSV